MKLTIFICLIPLSAVSVFLGYIYNKDADYCNEQYRAWKHSLGYKNHTNIIEHYLKQRNEDIVLSAITYLSGIIGTAVAVLIAISLWG